MSNNLKDVNMEAIRASRVNSYNRVAERKGMTRSGAKRSLSRQRDLLSRVLNSEKPMSLHCKKMNNYQLIQTIKARPALWNKLYWDRYDLRRREEVWEEVSKLLGVTKSITKARWKNLRDTYRKLIRKIENSETHDLSWPYFKAMEFLKDITIAAPPKVMDITLRNKPEGNVSRNSDSPLQLQSNTASSDETSSDPLLIKNKISDEINLKLEKDISFESSENRVPLFLELEPDKASESTSKFVSQKHDDDYQFLLSLYPHFKQVALSRKLPLRMKIEKLIYDELYPTHDGGEGGSCAFQV